MTVTGWAVWVTGLPASGKSTVARALKGKLSQLGVDVQILESDVMRRVLTPNPNYSPEERDAFYNSLVYVGVLLTQNGVNVIFDATANKRRWRRAARGLIDKFIQVYIRCPLEVCRERDPKGIYRKTETGEATYVPGAQEDYEEPLDADLELDCVRDSPEASAEKIVEVMRRNDFI
jgi:adenylylsulfate kinase